MSRQIVPVISAPTERQITNTIRAVDADCDPDDRRPSLPLRCVAGGGLVTLQPAAAVRTADEGRWDFGRWRISPAGVAPFDLPPQTALFAPGPDPEMLAEVSAKLRKAAGLPAKPTGIVANDGNGENGKGVVDKVKDAVTQPRHHAGVPHMRDAGIASTRSTNRNGDPWQN